MQPAAAGRCGPRFTREPSSDAAASLDSPLGGTRFLRALRALDAILLLGLGSLWSSWCFIHPYPALGAYEMVLALVGVPVLRAVLVPSSGVRTFVLTAAACVPGLVSSFVAAKLRGLTMMTPATLTVLVGNWCSCSQHLYATPVPPSKRTGLSIPGDLEAVVMRCLEKDRGARYAEVRALRDALDACLAANRWTEADALAWWERHGHTAPTCELPDSRGPATIAVDLAERAAFEATAPRLPTVVS